jgi:hypothetical protein
MEPEAPAGPEPARLEAAAAGPGGALAFGRWWALHGGLLAAYQRECADFVRWLQPGVRGQRRALKAFERRVRAACFCDSEERCDSVNDYAVNDYAVNDYKKKHDYAARELAHEVRGLLWDITEFRRRHVRAERALEELGDAIHHDLLWMRTEDSGPNRARIALCRTAASMRKVVRGLEGRLRGDEHALAVLAV